MIKNIAVLIAMTEEAEPLIKQLELAAPVPVGSPMGCMRYTGVRNGTSVSIVVFGKDKVHNTGVNNVGTVCAAMATVDVIQNVKPDLIVSAGTCGGFGKMGAVIGDAYLTTECVNHDRRVPLPGYDVFGKGQVKCARAVKLVGHLGMKEGICTTGNSLDATEEDMKRMEELGAHVKDMEGGAVSYACAVHEVPFMGVKVVTDIVDGDRPTEEEFLENLGTAAASLQAIVPRVIDYVAAKKVEEL